MAAQLKPLLDQITKLSNHLIELQTELNADIVELKTDISDLSLRVVSIQNRLDLIYNPIHNTRWRPSMVAPERVTPSTPKSKSELFNL